MYVYIYNLNNHIFLCRQMFCVWERERNPDLATQFVLKGEQ